jgi:Autographiviridae endonuclease
MLLFDLAAPSASLNTKAIETIAKLATVEPPRRRARQNKPISERLWAKVQKSDKPDGCWLWTGAKQSSGYGNISITNGKQQRMGAHRVAFEVANGVTLAIGERVLHSRRCTSKLCCRPSHLRRGSQAENIAEAGKAGALGKRKLTADLAREIAKLYGEGIKLPALSAQFGVTPQNIQHVIKGRSWSHATGIPPSGRALTRKPRATVENSASPRKGTKHQDRGAVAVAA